MNLYEIDKKIEECLLNITDAETGEVIGEQADFDKLNDLQIVKEEKIENIALWYKNLIAEANALKAEKDNFAKREKQAKDKAESLKKYLDYVLQGEKFKTDKCMVTYRKSEVVEVEDLSKLDEEYLTFKEPSANKSEIKKAIKNGAKIDGCSIVEKLNIGVK